MTTTKRHRERDSQESKANSSPPAGDLELQTRIACKGKSANSVLEEVRRALEVSAARDRDPLVVLENLGLLRDSVATLIKGLSRLLVDYPRTVTFWESSGYTEAFLSVMEKKVQMGPLPRVESSQKPAARGDGAARPIVVCVDNDAQILKSLARLVRREEYELRTTTDPEEALDWVRTEKVALLIAGYRMPQMSGTTLLKLVKACSPVTAQLLLTGYPGESLVIAAGSAGLMDMVGKPWDDDALKGKIRSLLAGGVSSRDALGSLE